MSALRRIIFFIPVKSALILFLILTLCGSSLAAGTQGRWGIGLEGGVMKLTEGYWDYSNADQFAALVIDRGLSYRWNLQLALKYGYVRPGAEYRGEDVGWDGKSGAAFYNVIFQPVAHLQYRFVPDSRISPWAGLGMGFTNWKVVDKTGESVGLFPSGDAISGYDINGDETDLKGTNFTFSFQLGADFFITESLAFNIGGRYHLMPGNEIDNVGMSHVWGPDHVDANTAMVEGMVGLTWWFGASDSDHDGISNKYDKCPDQPEDMDGFNDLDGCPDLDNDRDGIPDLQDSCPNQPEDMDGFQDEDGCPDPDNDGDGIVDARDQCPDEPEDMDGFEDEDGCPEIDNDGDGVADTEDTCPDTPNGVQVDENGCPVAAEIPQTLVLKGVSFRLGSAQLTASSISVLAEVAASLRSWPNKNVEIRGHTDNTGTPEGNRELSQRRAMSVRDSLIQMGISASRITAVGYGQDFPIADNNTVAGRNSNRRVEVHVIN
jgi:outer membrane protein OmpA-like peptidoglycan-associated protein/opacity protein-like surface antigen